MLLYYIIFVFSSLYLTEHVYIYIHTDKEKNLEYWLWVFISQRAVAPGIDSGLAGLPRPHSALAACEEQPWPEIKTFIWNFFAYVHMKNHETLCLAELGIGPADAINATTMCLELGPAWDLDLLPADSESRTSTSRTSDLGSRTSNLGLRTSDIGPRTLDLEPRTSGLEPRTSDLEPRASDLEPRTSDLGPRTSSLGPRTSDLEPRTSRLGPRTSNLEPRASNLEPRTSNLGPRTSDLALRASDLGLRASDLEHSSTRASSLEPWASNLGPRASDLEPRTSSNLGPRTSDLDLGPRTSGRARCQVRSGICPPRWRELWTNTRPQHLPQEPQMWRQINSTSFILASARFYTSPPLQHFFLHLIGMFVTTCCCSL